MKNSLRIGLVSSWFAWSCAFSLTATADPTEPNPRAIADEKPAKPQKPAKGKPGDAKGDGVVEPKVGAILDRFMQSKKIFPEGFNGSVLVAKGGEILLEKGYGIADAAKNTPIRADALWDWCSITKQFTAAAILKLEMQKKLSIDAPLAKVCPDCPKDKAKVTLRMLMNHTSGIDNTCKTIPHDAFTDREQMMKGFLNSPLISEPGSKWDYSNVAYFFLAGLIEKVSGQPYEKFIHEQLWKPGGVTDAFLIGDGDLDIRRVPKDDRGKGVEFAYGPRLTWGYRGAGGAVLTPRAMLAWDRALRGDKVLSADAKKKYYEVGKDNYALGWEISNVAGDTVAAHSGHTGNVITYYLRNLTGDIVVAIAYSYEPPTHPQITANNLMVIAKNGKAPSDLE